MLIIYTTLELLKNVLKKLLLVKTKMRVKTTLTWELPFLVSIVLWLMFLEDVLLSHQLSLKEKMTALGQELFCGHLFQWKI